MFLAVFGVDTLLTICHCLVLHENIFKAHRKQVYQLLANELKILQVVALLILIVKYYHLHEEYLIQKQRTL